MPDWFRKVSRKLENSKFSAEERREISRELGNYLEDSCEVASSRGLDDRAATQRAISELYEDKNLGANLFRARREGYMNLNDRTKQFWFPVIVMLLASATLLAAFQIGALRAYDAYAPTQPARNLSGFVVVGNLMRLRGLDLVFYLAWLYTLPFLGAAGAYWSRRVGSGLAAQIFTGLSPLLLFAAIFVGQHAAAQQGTSLSFLAMDVLPPAHVFFPFWTALSNLLLTWIVIPAAALLLGVLPFFWKSGIRGHDSSASATVA
ncbi:MAG: hypothetical protein WBR26_11905 [Candidatus Acidiferrum sp.]